MLFSPFNQPRAAGQIPFAPWGDDFDIGVQRIGRQFKPHLIIAFASRTMRDGIGPGFGGNLDQPFGNQWAGNRRAEKIISLIARIGAHHRKDKIADKFFAQIVDINMVIGHAHQHRFGARRFQLFALPQIGGEGDNFAAIFDLQPFQYDACVETA